MRAFLNAGAHVLVEKPMTDDTAQAATLVDLARARGCVLQVGHVERFNPVFKYLETVATQPRFILLDEPFAGVDPLSVNDIQRICRHLAERGIGVLITDHNVRETLGICDHAYIISEGSVLAAGSPAQIIENEDVRKVYLGDNFRM